MSVIRCIEVSDVPQLFRARIVLSLCTAGFFPSLSHSGTQDWMGSEHSIQIHVPPLATVAFKLEK
jgi:hypothetical protein